MSSKGLFLQNVIAVIWDFDKTLSPDNMQKPIFDEYGIVEEEFWAEVNGLKAYYQRACVEIQEDTCYLGHMLAYVRAGRMPGLTNAKLRELGSRVELFPGLPDCFERLRGVLDQPEFEGSDLKLEHYIVSTGLDAMIRGNAIASAVDGIWASSFIEAPAGPNEDLSGTPGAGLISQIASVLDNTTKTRAIFEINKGVNVESGISVNDSIPDEQRRVPIENMIYIADGPSDIPSFSVVRDHGGLAYAVYDPESPQHFQKAMSLLENKRVDDYGEADYREGSKTEQWLRIHIERIARRNLASRRKTTEESVKPAPSH